jgi:hypothetical protein
MEELCETNAKSSFARRMLNLLRNTVQEKVGKKEVGAATLPPTCGVVAVTNYAKTTFIRLL